MKFFTDVKQYWNRSALASFEAVLVYSLLRTFHILLVTDKRWVNVIHMYMISIYCQFQQLTCQPLWCMDLSIKEMSNLNI